MRKIINKREINVPIWKINVPIYAKLLSNPNGKKFVATITERITVNEYNNYIATLENGKKYYCVQADGYYIIDDTVEVIIS